MDGTPTKLAWESVLHLDSISFQQLTATLYIPKLPVVCLYRHIWFHKDLLVRLRFNFKRCEIIVACGSLARRLILLGEEL